MSNKKSYRLAVIGFGDVHRWHAAALDSISCFETVAGYDVDPSKPPLIKGLTRYNTLDSMLDSKSFDAVLIAVSTDQHYDVAVEVLGRGIPVLLEKPAVTNWKDLTSLYSIAAQNHTLLVTAFHDAFGIELITFVKSHGKIMEQEFGPPIRFYCEYRDPYVYDGSAPQRARSLVGSWFDSGVNALSVLFEIWSELELDWAVSYNSTFSFDAWARAQLKGKTIVGTIETDWLSPMKHKRTMIQYGDITAPTFLEINHSYRIIRLHSASGVKEIYQAEKETHRLTDQYTRVFEDYCHRLTRGEDNQDKTKNIHSLLFEVQSKIATR